MEDSPFIGICGAWIGVFGDKKSIIRYPEHNEQIRIDLLFSCPLAHPTIMMRKDVRDRLNILYRIDHAAAQDYELWSRISESVRFANLREVCSLSRAQGSSRAIQEKSAGIICKGREARTIEEARNRSGRRRHHDS